MYRAGSLKFVSAVPLLIAALGCVLASATTLAQQTTTPAAPAQRSAPDMPTPEQLEPAVSTTPPEPAPVPSSTAPSTVSGAASAESSAAGPARTSRATGTAPAASAPHKGPDRLELDATEITGNRELPKVLYIVPWKRSDIGDLTGKPVNSLLDEVLEPLDRDVFQRENRYYNGLKAPAATPQGGVPQGADTRP